MPMAQPKADYQTLKMMSDELLSKKEQDIVQLKTSKSAQQEINADSQAKLEQPKLSSKDEVKIEFERKSVNT